MASEHTQALPNGMFCVDLCVLSLSPGKLHILVEKVS